MNIIRNTFFEQNNAYSLREFKAITEENKNLY